MKLVLPTTRITPLILSATGSLSFLLLLLYKEYRKRRIQKQRGLILRPKRLVIVTGCDSGLGLSMAVWTHRLGFPVIASVVNTEGSGALILKDEGIKFVIQLDLTKDESVKSFCGEVRKIMEENELELWSLILNSAFLVCGEFMWQTGAQLQRQIDVNFLGPAKLVKNLQPLLFHNRSRLIIISSDCSKIQLPGLAFYGASKAALESWCRSLRLEIGKYGVTVMSYHPGSFPFSSQIFSGHGQHYEEMEKEMSQVDKEFYGEYFQGWKEVKGQHSLNLPPIQVLDSPKHKRDLSHFLDGDIKGTPVYEYETFGQKILLWAERYLPRSLSDRFLRSVMDGEVKEWDGLKYLDVVNRSQ